MPQPDPRHLNRLRQPAAAHQGQARKCNCGCQPEAVHVGELHRDYGRMSTSLTPHTVERLSIEWMYAGESGTALRLDLSAVGMYWVGQGVRDGQAFSYLEAVDAFGDLILRLSRPQSYRYWQGLAPETNSTT